MNLEQIVKETVAKIVAEKKGKDLTGDGKIDSADYLQARSNAIEKAKNLDEDYEVAMAQDSLDSIIRAAMMLKSQMGDREVNLPAWIQDHITNSENYIYQAAKGYHESDAQIANHAGEEEMNEARVSQDGVAAHLAHVLEYVWIAGKGNNPINFQDMAQSLYSDMFGDDEMNEARFEKGEDVGGKGFEFKKIAKKAAKQYGSKEAGQRVAGAIMKKVLNKEGEGFDFVKSSIESTSGDKISHTEEDDYGRTIYWSTKNPNVNYFVGMGGEFEGKIYLYNGETGERYPIGDLKHYGDGQNHAADDDMHEAFQPKSSFDDYKIGDNAMLAGKKVKITGMEMDDETGERRARVKFEDGTIKKINMNSLDEAQELDEAENTPMYYAVFDFHGKQPFYMTSRSAMEMLSRLNGYIKATGNNFLYDMSDLEDSYYNSTLLPSVINDDFAMVTKNPEFFKKHLTYYPNAVEYKGLNSIKQAQELDEWTIRRMQHYAGIK